MTHRNHRLAVRLAFCLLLPLLVGSTIPNREAGAATCEFRLGFAALKAAIPNVVGDCVENERHATANGNAIQQTTRGLLVWRKADNFTAFTDGFRSWIVISGGIAERRNSSTRGGRVRITTPSSVSLASGRTASSARWESASSAIMPSSGSARFPTQPARPT
jgi:hypothetical protein